MDDIFDEGAPLGLVAPFINLHTTALLPCNILVGSFITSQVKENVTFATAAGDKGFSLHEHFKCHSCGQSGHFSDLCPVTSSAGANANGGAANEQGNNNVLLQKVKRFSSQSGGCYFTARSDLQS